MATIPFHYRFINQSNIDYYVDPINGDNNNNGDIANPVKDLFEIAARVHGHLIKNCAITVNLLGDVQEIPDFFIDSNYGGIVSIKGQRTLIGSGSITALQTYNLTTKEDQRITDSGIPVSWTDSGFVGGMIVLTSGINQDAYAWVHSDLGANQAIVSPFYNPNTGTFVEPQVGNTYSIFSLTKITGGINGKGGLNGLALYDLHIEFDEVAWVDPIYINGGYFYMYGCIVDGLDDPGDSGDPYGHFSLQEGCVAYVYGCWIKAHLRANSGSYLSLGCNLYTGFGTAPTADGGGSVVNISLPCTGYGEQTFLQSRDGGGLILVSSDSWYMAANQTYGLYCRDNGKMQLKGKVWGYGITDYGVKMGANSTILYEDGMQPDFVNNPIGPTYPTTQVDLGGVSIAYDDLLNTQGVENIANGTKMGFIYIPD